MSDTSQMNWYVLHTYSAYENKVKTSIEKTVENVGMSDLINRVVIPEETMVDIKDGVEKIKKRKIFPGYVFIQMVVTNDTWYVVRNTKGVTGFIGVGNKPIPLSEEEVKKLHLGEEDYQELKYDIEIGDEIVIIDGPFADRTALVDQVYLEKKMVKAHINMFGKKTDIELNFSQIKKNKE